MEQYKLGWMLATTLWMTACVQSNSESCGALGTCPAGRHCALAAGEVWCVTDDQLASCAGQPDFAECPGGGVCRDAVCLPIGCGNGRIDPGEACDDGGNVSGDGCSADCHSNETCGNGIVDLATEQCDDGVLRAASSHDGCSSSCTTELPQWDLLAATTEVFQSARPSAAYDLVRGRIVVFGDARSLTRTIEWDGRGWNQRSVFSGPPQREAASMAYDAERRRTVLFGGLGFNDTWEWDGATWSLRAPPRSPPARGAAAVAYDERAKRVVLFGGRTGIEAQLPPIADTWTWDGTTWTMMAPGATHPPARSDAAMTYDPVRDVIVLFGGVDGGSVKLDDTWELRAGVWTDVSSTTRPPARKLHGMAFDPVGRRVLMSGGSSGATAETWAWNGVSWARLAMSGFTTPAVLVTMGREGYVAGISAGQNARWNGTAWVTIDGSVTPAFPFAHGAGAVDVAGRRVVIHGGTALTTTVVWSGAWTRLPQPIGVGPGTLGYAAMAFDEKRREFVLFGGSAGGASPDSGRTWVFDGATWTERVPATAPSPRASLAMAYDAARERVVLFGGNDSTGKLGDTWVWDGALWTERPGAGPSPRSDAAMTYDPVAQTIVLFGGDGGNGELSDTWLWNGTAWTRQLVSGPGARFSSAIAWDPARRSAVLFGGASSSTVFNDIWEWSGSAWSQVPLISPLAPRAGHLMTTSFTGAGVLSLGGALRDGTMVNDVARLQWAGATQDETGVYADLDGDGRGATGCAPTARASADPDTWMLCAPSCPPGDTAPASCSAGSRGCGDGTCDARGESCITCPEDCGACPAVCGDSSCDGGESPGSCPGDC